MRLLTRPAALAVLLILVLTGAVVAAMHGPELVQNVADRVFAADNVLLIALLYPLAKVFHEAGHAYAVKLNGGAVHELGLMLLVFVPMPYVDASSSAGFTSPARRIAVSAAGMMAELVLAALASLAWANLDPGPTRAAMLDILVLCGVSTLLFNANPLLRFDGYYVLIDLIGVPNLDTRAKKQVQYLVRRYLLGMRDAESAVELPGEGKWLVGYGVLCQLYRVVMVVVIALLIANKLFGLGVALAIVLGGADAGVAGRAWRALAAVGARAEGAARAGAGRGGGRRWWWWACCCSGCRCRMAWWPTGWSGCRTKGSCAPTRTGS